MRSEEELLGVVHARAADLIRTRRRRRGTATATAAMLIAILATISAGGTNPPRELTTVDDESTPSTEPDRQDLPSTTTSTSEETSIPSTTLSPAATPTTAEVTPPCPSEVVSLSATLDRAIYQQGDVIHAIATLANSSDITCWVPTNADVGCAPSIGAHHYFEGDDTEPPYNAALSYQRETCPLREVIPANGVFAVPLDLYFGPQPSSDDRYFTRAGTWDVGVGWDPYGAVLQTIECPEPGCRKGSFDNPPPG